MRVCPRRRETRPGNAARGAFPVDVSVIRSAFWLTTYPLIPARKRNAFLICARHWVLTAHCDSYSQEFRKWPCDCEPGRLIEKISPAKKRESARGEAGSRWGYPKLPFAPFRPGSCDNRFFLHGKISPSGRRFFFCCKTNFSLWFKFPRTRLPCKPSLKVWCKTSARLPQEARSSSPCPAKWNSSNVEVLALAYICWSNSMSSEIPKSRWPTTERYSSELKSASGFAP